MTKLGLEDHFDIQDNPDYFKSAKLSTILQNDQARMYGSEQDFRKGIITVLNKMFKHDKDVMVLKRTEKYLNIKCKYVGCKFVLWYNENKKELGKDI